MSFTVNFGYKKSGRVLYIAHLSRNNSQELFFRFILSDIKATHYYDGVNKVEEDISSIDHLSIHKDGTAHIRYFGLSKKPKKISSNKLRPLIEMPQIAPTCLPQMRPFNFGGMGSLYVAFGGGAPRSGRRGHII